MRLTVLTSAVLFAAACAAQAPKSPAHRWATYVEVEGQPLPVPTEWVSTSEGKFAHSIKTPNPLPIDSGYRSGVTSEQYFHHLCDAEAGEFIYRTAEGVEGFYFMRPPKRPSDEDLMARYVLEDPYTERFYQLRGDALDRRPAQFVNPPFNNYRYVEEPRRDVSWQRSVTEPYVRMSGYRYNDAAGKLISPMKIEGVAILQSRYAYTWRGIRRKMDREHAIAGGELIVIDRDSMIVMGMLRNYVISPRARNTPDNIWWLNARSCPQFPSSYKDNLGKQIYEFVSKVLKPSESAN
jgi:hypothetical protein